MRSERRLTVKVIAIALGALLALAGCRGDRERGLTADSAVMQHQDPLSPGDTVVGDTALLPIPDTLRGSAGDTLADTLRDPGGAPIGPPPVLVLRADSIAGDELFRRKGICVTCHAVGGMGIRGLGPDLTDETWLHADGTIASIQRIIRQGVVAPVETAMPMPAFEGSLTSEEIFRIAAYVYTLSHPGSVVADTTRLDAAGATPPPE
jgi:mono/diheme cytochrome c family protein